jgi:Flp pilus assembly protein TadD
MPAEAERARAALREVAALPRLPAAHDRTVEDALRETIGGLGYTAAAAGGREVPDPAAPSALPSPAARHEEHRDVLRAMELLNLGLADPARFAEAEGLLREVLRTNPKNWFARDRLAIALIQEQRFDEAIELLSRLLAEGPRWANSAFNLGVSLLEAGREDEAPRAFLTALAADPRIARDVAALPEHYRSEGREEIAASLERFLRAHDLTAE